MIDFFNIHEDCIRALQFIRSKAGDWGFAATGTQQELSS